MSKVISVQLEWQYSPENYLEEPILIEFQGVELEIKDGVAVAAIAPEVFHVDELIREELTKKIESRLHAVQIMTHKDFELSKPSRTDIREDGKNNQFLEAELCVITSCVGTVDFVVHDKDGNVVSDSKRDRLDKQHALATLIDKHWEHDTTLDLMLKSYNHSVKDPNDELVHLYEIRDALANRFSSTRNAIKALGITKGEWDEIGKLANILPLKQGRHRGQSAGTLRDAEPAELEMARESAFHLINKYLMYLEACQHH